MSSTSTPESVQPERQGGHPGQRGAHPERPIRNGALARLVHWVDRLSDGLDQAATWVAACVLLVMVATVATQVFFRFVLQNSLSWSEELSRYCFIWLSLLGSSSALKRGMHPALGGLGKALPARFRPWIFTLCKVAAACVLWVLFSKGLELARFNMRQTSPAMGLPMGVPYAAIPVACGLMLVHLASSLFHPGTALSTSPEQQGQSAGDDSVETAATQRRSDREGDETA